MEDTTELLFIGVILILTVLEIKTGKGLEHSVRGMTSSSYSLWETPQYTCERHDDLVL